jgi:MYXO-CTERM domain-containing protein
MPPLLLALLLTAPAGATDTWSDPAPGVRYLHRTSSTPWQIHALEVDLCARGVATRATREGERQRSTSSFGNLVGAQAAINGDFFSYDGYWPTGMAVGAGEHWHADNGWEGFLALGQDRAGITDEDESWSSPAAWMDEAVGGYPVLVRDGEPLSSYIAAPSHCPDRHPRSAVGLSEDRQTLWMVVVDGRSSSSAGMTCPELSGLMADLGAHTALNLDGGGSSAIWTSAWGVLNDPSDGSERTVANHLAVWASGSGAPESCDFWLNEVIVGAHLLDGGSTDVDGDGLADACARAAAGLRCQRSSGTGFPAGWELADLSNDAGFTEPEHYGTLRWGDLDGDGAADVCARGADGVRCWLGDDTGFSEAIEGPSLSDDSGWAGIDHWSTLRLADITGDGRDDLCARAAAGFRCYPSTGDGFGDAIGMEDLSDSLGWTHPRYYGSIRMADIDGDGRDDLCARGGAQVYCWRSTGDGFESLSSLPAWSDDAGWDEVASWSTIRLSDVDGDGRADLCGRGPEGFVCHLGEGETFGEAIEGPELSDASGWGDHSNYATIHLADLDGDGDRDLLARADAGVRWWAWNGSGFDPSVAGPELSDDLGWDDHRYYTTLRTADLNGDGAADLCARGPDGLTCWLGPALDTEIEGPAWSDSSGWDGERYYSTLRVAGGRGGGDDPVDTDDPGPDDDTDDGDGDAPGLRHPEQGCNGCASGRGTSGWWLLGLTGLLARRRRGFYRPATTMQPKLSGLQGRPS